jgi:hypothetical protein
MGLFAILMFFVGISVRSYFASQREKKLAEESKAALWKIEHETEAALLTRISLAWPPGKYIFCRYDLPPNGKARSTCIQCMLGGKEPITDFEMCSLEMEKQRKLAVAEELKKSKKSKKKGKKDAVKKRNK